jgi:endo-beta-N-acetylglucosaminidase D
MNAHFVTHQQLNDKLWHIDSLEGVPGFRWLDDEAGKPLGEEASQ